MNREHSWQIFAISLLSSLVCGSLNVGAQLAIYPIATANSSTSSTVGPTSVSPGLSASDLSATGVIPSSSFGLDPDQGYFTFSNWETGSSPDLGKYYSFTITPDPGFQVSFSSVTYTLAAQGPSTYELRSSVDGYTANFGAHTLLQSSPGVLTDQNTFTDNVSSLGVHTGAVTFRLFGYNSDGSDEGLVNNDGEFGGIGDLGQNLQINGTVSVVPEPQMYGAIAALSLLAFCIYRGHFLRA